MENLEKRINVGPEKFDNKNKCNWFWVSYRDKKNPMKQNVQTYVAKQNKQGNKAWKYP